MDNDEVKWWKLGAEARVSNVSLSEGLRRSGLSRYDYDQRNAFKSGWVEMHKFLLMSEMLNSRGGKTVF